MPSLHPEWIAPDLSDRQRADEKDSPPGDEGDHGASHGAPGGEESFKVFYKEASQSC